MVAGTTVMFPAVVVRFNYEEATRLAKRMGMTDIWSTSGAEKCQLLALDFVLDRITTILLDSTRIPGSALVLMPEEEIEKQRVLVFNQILESLGILKQPTLRELHRDNFISSRFLHVQAENRPSSQEGASLARIQQLEARVSQLESIINNKPASKV
jgi:hypothetical protein